MDNVRPRDRIINLYIRRYVGLFTFFTLGGTAYGYTGSEVVKI